MKSNTHAERRKYHIIYKTTCIITGRWYLGLHSTDYLDDGYRGSGTRLQYSLKKYGKENHTFEILEFLPSRKELVQREIELITEEMVKDPMCMNLMKGGGREVHANILKEKAREKISAVAKEMWARRRADPDAYQEHIEKLNKSEHIQKRIEAIKAKGHKRSPEQLARLRAAQTKHYSTVSKDTLIDRGQKAAKTRLENGSNKGGRPKGIPMTEDQKIQLSKITSGIPKTADHKAKAALGVKRYYENIDPAVLKERAARQAETRSKEWKIGKIDGSSMTIKNLRAFCDSIKVSRNKFRRTLNTGNYINDYRLLPQ
jgi:hypothetical protein